MAARNINDTDWTSSLFVVKQEDGLNKVTVPKNIETFSESLLMMSILKIFELKQYQPVLSTKELPKAVLETKEGAFFAGFVSAALRETTGPMSDGTSKYAKGVRAFQTYSVEKVHGKARHLKTGGLTKVTERLSSMKGFTQEYWGLRGSVVTIFKSLRPVQVTDLETYMLSKNELLKNIKTKLQSENGGCYRPEEMNYLSSKYQGTKDSLNMFLSRLERPTEDLAKNFDAQYAVVKSQVDAADSEIKANLAARARILFPQSKRKQDINWAKKPLIEKLTDLSEDKLSVFRPETLPGIATNPLERPEGMSLQRFIQGRYTEALANSQAKDVILSWYSNFEEE